jgi:NAD(P)-dependent dehydrogenase (short-subunit alcohol dehydrogenase family)
MTTDSDGPRPIADLSGRTALVSGGTSGLGLCTARKLLEAGAGVVVTGRNSGRGEDARRALAELGPIEFVAADARSREATEHAFDVAEARFGPVTLLVACAGWGVVNPLLDTSPEDWSQTMATNVDGSFFLAQSAIRRMRQHQLPGAAVLVASDAGVVGERSIGAYSVAKAAVVMMTKVLALDAAPSGVRVNCICPGYVVPGMRDFPDRSGGPGYVDPPVPPVGRYGSADDIAESIMFLLSDRAAFVTGAVLMAEGGITAGIS